MFKKFQTKNHCPHLLTCLRLTWLEPKSTSQWNVLLLKRTSCGIWLWAWMTVKHGFSSFWLPGYMSRSSYSLLLTWLRPCMSFLGSLRSAAEWLWGMLSVSRSWHSSADQGSRRSGRSLFSQSECKPKSTFTASQANNVMSYLLKDVARRFSS